MSQHEVVDETPDFSAFPRDLRPQLRAVAKTAQWLADHQPDLSVRVLHRPDYFAVVIFSREPGRPVLYTSQDFHPDWMEKRSARAFASLQGTYDALLDIQANTARWVRCARYRHGLLDEATEESVVVIEETIENGDPESAITWTHYVSDQIAVRQIDEAYTGASTAIHVCATYSVWPLGPSPDRVRYKSKAEYLSSRITEVHTRKEVRLSELSALIQLLLAGSLP